METWFNICTYSWSVDGKISSVEVERSTASTLFHKSGRKEAKISHGNAFYQTHKEAAEALIKILAGHIERRESEIENNRRLNSEASASIEKLKKILEKEAKP